MANIEITNNASATLQVWAPIYKMDQTFTSAGTVTYPQGMLVTLTAGKYVPYVNGAGAAHGLLYTPIEDTIAGDYPVTILIGGEVREDQCGISSAMTALASDDILALQNYGIITRVTTQLGELDNQ